MNKREVIISLSLIHILNEALLAYLSSMPFKLYSEGGYNVSSFGSTEMFTGQNLRCDIGYNTCLLYTSFSLYSSFVIKILHF